MIMSASRHFYLSALTNFYYHTFYPIGCSCIVTLCLTQNKYEVKNNVYFRQKKEV
jgi:hypothetical protein